MNNERTLESLELADVACTRLLRLTAILAVLQQPLAVVSLDPLPRVAQHLNNKIHINNTFTYMLDLARPMKIKFSTILIKLKRVYRY